MISSNHNLIVDDENRTHSIKKYSVYSLDASDRSKRILINFAFVSLKVDNFHQLRIQVLKEIVCYFWFDQSSKHILSARVCAVVSQLAHQSAITYDSHLSSQSYRADQAQFNAAKIAEIDSLSQ